MEQQWQVQRSFPRSITHKRRAERHDPELARETSESYTLAGARHHGPSTHTEGEKHPCDTVQDFPVCHEALAFFF